MSGPPLSLPLDLPYLSAKSEGMQLVEPLMAQRQEARLAPGLRKEDIPQLQLQAVEIEDKQSLMRISPTISRESLHHDEVIYPYVSTNTSIREAV